MVELFLWFQKLTAQMTEQCVKGKKNELSKIVYTPSSGNEVSVYGIVKEGVYLPEAMFGVTVPSQTLPCGFAVFVRARIWGGLAKLPSCLIGFYEPRLPR